MNRNASSVPRAAVWLIGWLVLILALVMLWVGFFNGPEPTRSANGLQVAQVASAGGAKVPDDAPIAEEVMPAFAETVYPVFAPEQIVIVSDASAAGGLRVHADARRDAPVLEVYADGEPLTILDPSGDYSTYPVQNDGVVWYRVRDRNGLVSWAESRFLTATGP